MNHPFSLRQNTLLFSHGNADFSLVDVGPGGDLSAPI